MKKYDVIIIGAGPAGIFAALELIKSSNIKILIVEKGKDINKRNCPAKAKNIGCLRCSSCSILCGWGGAGAFSDGKLTLSSEVGGYLSRYLEEENLKELISEIDKIYLDYGAPKRIYGDNIDEVQRLKNQAAKYDLELIPYKIRHMGTECARKVLKNIQTLLDTKLDIKFETTVDKLIVENQTAVGIKTAEGEEIYADFIISAPGREGSKWLRKEAEQLNLEISNNPVDIGVRVELPATILEHITDIAYESKLVFYSKHFDDRVRTFCMCPHGEVVKEYDGQIFTVNGQGFTNRKTNNTNFAILVSTSFTEPFNEPISYARYIANLANFLGKGVLVQRLGDLQAGQRSTPERIKRGVVKPTLKEAIPGDLSFVLPYRYLTSILEMLEALNNIAPGINSHHTLLYGVEVKLYSFQPKLTKCLETQINNLFAVGDGAGVSRGLIQASASGVIAAQEIRKRM